MAEPIDLPFGLCTQVGRRKHKYNRIHSAGGASGPLMGKGRPIVRYRDTLRSIFRLGCGLGWAEGSTSSIVFARLRQCALMGGHIGATWRMRLNRSSAAAMRPYVKLF